MIQLKTTRSIGALLCAGIFSACLANAGEDKVEVVDESPTVTPAKPWNIFEKNTLYKSDSGFIRDVKLKGRYHGQYISQDEDIGDVKDNEYDVYHHRRARIQMDFDLDYNLSFGFDANISDGHGSRTALSDEGSFINNFVTFNIQWKPSDDYYLIIGKDKQDITREDIISSRHIKTVERSAIVNEIGQQRPWGAQVGFFTKGIEHRLGAWVYGAHEDGPEWVDFRANKGASYNLTYPVKDDLSLHFDWNYVNNEGGLERARGDAAVGTFGSAYEHAFALGVDYEKGHLKSFLMSSTEPTVRELKQVRGLQLFRLEMIHGVSMYCLPIKLPTSSKVYFATNTWTRDVNNAPSDLGMMVMGTETHVSMSRTIIRFTLDFSISSVERTSSSWLDMSMPGANFWK